MLDQPCERLTQTRHIARLDENPARLVDNFERASQGGTDHRASGPECFDKNDPKWLRRLIWLAENVCRCQQLGHIRALPQETHPVGYAQVQSMLLEFLEVCPLLGPLRATHHPADPWRGKTLQLC